MWYTVFHNSYLQQAPVQKVFVKIFIVIETCTHLVVKLTVDAVVINLVHIFFDFILFYFPVMDREMRGL